MGLDMYLRCHKYISDYRQDEDGKLVFGVRKNNLFSVHGVEINADKVCEIVEEAGYWRKANQIHNWFVSNVQNGNDDCGTYYVSSEQLQALLDTVNEVLDHSELVYGEICVGKQITAGSLTPIMETGKVIADSTIAEKLLPTSPGFFFGATGYDQFYHDDLTHTKKILEEVLTNESDCYYHSSW